MALTDTSTIRRTKVQKFNALAGTYALRLAKQKNDPLYDKLTKVRRLYKALKKQLMVKYGQKGAMLARRALMGGGR